MGFVPIEASVFSQLFVVTIPKKLTSAESLSSGVVNIAVVRY